MAERRRGRDSKAETLYYVQGMHCPGCELRIEKRLREQEGVVSVAASTRRSTCRIRARGQAPAVAELNRLFEDDGYTFSNRPLPASGRGGLLPALGVAALLIGGFLLVQTAGLSGGLQVDASSSLPAFFVFGLLAGASSCAALLTGLILSLSRPGSAAAPFFDRAKPPLAFVAGRILGFALLGGVLGLVGGGLRLSLSLSSILVVAVSLLMAVLALQMLGFDVHLASSLALPKSLTGRIAAGGDLGRRMPFGVGVLTFFLPCGFTISAQSAALLSGTPLSGALIMGLFALGTAPALVGIGLFSAAFVSSGRLARQFSRVAGVLVLFFALYNLNAQATVLGLPSLADLNLGSTVSASNGGPSRGPAVPELVAGKQVIRMDASAFGYSPRWFRVRAGQPVRWEITDAGASGCTNAVISRKLFEGEIPLSRGKVSVKEFLPTRPGKYKFSCWMGMVWGVIEVVDGNLMSD